MPAITAALLALALTVAAVVVVRRRRRVGPGALVLPAGRKSLANNVGSLSSFGMDLRLPGPREGWRRLGTLLGVR